MTEFDACDRCEGTGAAPFQPLFVDAVAECRECGGEGRVASFTEAEALRLTA